jgi:hypothetical protein
LRFEGWGDYAEVSISSRSGEGAPQSDDALSQPIEQFVAAGARALVEAQKALDVRESLAAWEEEGLPPSAWTWVDCLLRFPVAFDVLSKSAPADGTRLSVVPREEGVRGSLTFTIRYLPAPSKEGTY